MRQSPPETSRSVHDLIYLAMLVCLTPGLVGCGAADGGRRAVTGTITLDGEPLPGGWIYFRPLAEGQSSAAEIADGAFELAAQDGLLAGTYHVSVEYHQPTGRMRKVYTGETIEEKRQIVPARYNQQTTLTATIDARGKNHLTFDLESS